MLRLRVGTYRDRHRLTQPGAETEFSDREPVDGVTDQEIQAGGLEGEFGKELPVEDLVVSLRFKGANTAIDFEAEDAGKKAHDFELQVENKGGATFDGSNSFVNAVSTDEGSGTRVDNVENGTGRSSKVLALARKRQ
ncbi:hypothetical protein [Brevibacterium linens]|uniref:hypothetical protein n=1 Tax=Brevibacterium linens TaxID=1703 RepID=UPI003F891B0E